MSDKNMKSSKIAIILNALVMPGLGHIYIGYKLRGILFAVTCVFFIVAPLAKFVMMTSYALNVMTVTNPNPLANLYQASRIAWPEVRTIVFLAIAAIVVIWGYGIFDVYRKSQNPKSKAQNPKPKYLDFGPWICFGFWTLDFGFKTGGFYA